MINNTYPSDFISKNLAEVISTFQPACILIIHLKKSNHFDKITIFSF
jgi:hypothetical protein